MSSTFREVVTVSVLLALVASALELRSGLAGEGISPGLVTMILGFTLVLAHLVGRVVGGLSLPKITGYLLAGILVGPHAFDLVSLAVKDRLQIITELALGLIALSAGGELVIGELKPRLRAIGGVTVAQCGLLFVGTAGALVLTVRFVRLTGGELPLTAGLTEAAVVAVALLLGLVATASSPSTAVAVINESRARGPLTTLTLGVTVVKDVVVLILMAITLTVAGGLIYGSSDFGWGALLTVLLEVATSLGAGALLGRLLISYLVHVDREVGLVLLAAVLATIEIRQLVEVAFGFHLHFLLIHMAAGFVVENFSERGPALIRALERSSLPVYVVFFTLSGVAFDLSALAAVWPFALGFVLWRGAATFLATWSAARWAGEPLALARSGWTGFVAQAGISLGLAELIASRFPGLGDLIRTHILAIVAVNQLVGPVLLKLALQRTGEAGRADDEAQEAEARPGPVVDAEPARH